MEAETTWSVRCIGEMTQVSRLKCMKQEDDAFVTYSGGSSDSSWMWT